MASFRRHAYSIFCRRYGMQRQRLFSSPGGANSVGRTGLFPLSCFVAGAVCGGSAIGLYLTFPHRAGTDETRVEAGPQRNKRVLYLMRGPPGCGKSTRAREILRERLEASGIHGDLDKIAPLSRAFILSTDDFFSAIDEETGAETYAYDVKKLREHHKRNWMRCAIAMETGVTPVFVDNTHTTLWEMKPYVELAKKHGYAVEIMDIFKTNAAALDVQVLKQRCDQRLGKDIPEGVIQRMVKRYESLPEDPTEAEAKIMQAERPVAPASRTKKSAADAPKPPGDAAKE